MQETGPQSARRQQAEERREQILDAALKLFSEKGYAGASIREVAREVGVTEGLLYHYFESKDRLLEACWRERSWRAQLERILAGSDGTPVGEVLRYLVRDFLQSLYENGSSVRMCAVEMQHNPEMANQYLRNIQDDQRVLTDFLQSRQAAGELRPEVDANIAGRLLMGSAFSSFLLFGRQAKPDWDRFVDDFAGSAVDVLVHGIAATPVRGPGSGHT